MNPKRRTESDGPVRCSAWLGITVTVINPVTVSVDNPPGLAQILKSLKRHKMPKRLYFPLRGIPDGHHSVCVVGNQLRALLGEGRVSANSPVGMVLGDREANEAGTHQVIDNLGKCLLIEADIFFHGRRVMPNDSSSATRPARRVDWNRSVLAGFAAAPG